MTGPEMLYRARLRLRSERQRRVAGKWPALGRVLIPDKLSVSHDIAETALAQFQQQRRLSSSDAASWLHAERPHAVARTLDAAAAILAGEVCLFGRTAEVGTRPDWTRDPFTQRAWPLVYWTSVNYRGGGAKYVWELNRQQHLPTLARAYRLTGDEAYAELALAHMTDWIDGNPYLRGINWTSGLELALRVIAWAWTLDLVADSPALTPVAFAKIVGAVHAQASFIAQNLSRYSSANNHLIGEAAGLVTAGTLFPMLRGASRWRDLGARLISEETPKQIHADGGSAEQAVHYLAFVCDLVLQCVVLLKRAGVPYAESVDQRLTAAANFLGDVTTSDGDLFHIGDSDDGRALPLDDDSPAVADVCTRLAAHTGSVSVAHAGHGRDEAVVWLFGPDAVRTVQGLVGQPHHHPPRQSYSESGYTLFRSRRDAADRVLLIDHGPLGYLSQAAHGHADALSVCYSQRGVPLLIDPGTGTYHEDRRVREYFRGTTAHNTITVDGQPQSEPTGPTIWGRKARVVDLRSGTDGDIEWVSALHDGYARLAVPVRHRRTVVALPSAFIIVDELLGPAAHHQLALGWHLPIGAECALDGAAATVCHKDQRLSLHLDVPTGCEVVRIRGQESPLLQGWVSERYGHRAPAWTVVAGGTVAIPAAFVTLLADEKQKVRLLVAGRAHAAAEQSRLDISVDDEESKWRLRLRNGEVTVMTEPGGRHGGVQATVLSAHGREWEG